MKASWKTGERRVEIKLIAEASGLTFDDARVVVSVKPIRVEKHIYKQQPDSWLSFVIVYSETLSNDELYTINGLLALLNELLYNPSCTGFTSYHR